MNLCLLCSCLFFDSTILRVLILPYYIHSMDTGMPSVKVPQNIYIFKDIVFFKKAMVDHR